MPDQWKQWARSHRLLAGAMAWVAVCALFYAADWAVLMLRERTGGAHGMVVVESTDVVREKGNKLEFFDNPPQPVPCVHALFPQQGEAPCWWLARHSEQERHID